MLSASLLASLYACGDDSSSVMQSPSTKSELSSSSSSWDENETKDSSVIGEIIETGMGSANVIHEDFYDSKTKLSYGTIQMGAYIWMTENASYEPDDVKTVCYDNDEMKCGSYGRLYGSFGASDACPDDFFVPRKVDYEYLMSFAGNLYTSSVGFDLKMGGYCVGSGSSMTCSDLGKTANFITWEGDVVQVNRGGKAQFIKKDNSGAYSLRCAKFNHFVDTQKFLPKCDSSSRTRLGSFYVAEEGSNYRCNGKEWEPLNSKSCSSSDNGRKFYYKDSLFICDETWKLAPMDESIDACFELNQWSDRQLNGIRYVCDDGSWRKTSAVEDSIGFCYSERFGMVDSVLEKNSYVAYYCDSTGWRDVALEDALGPCDSLSFNEVASFRGTKRVCRTNGTWGTLTAVEADLGICTSTIQGKLDSLVNSHSYYICDTLKWRRASFEEVYGECTTERLYEVAYYERTIYACRKTNRWTTLDYVEKDLGVCDSKRVGEVDTLSSEFGIYACDTMGWRGTSVSEIYGKCDEKNLNKIVELDDYQYGCDGSGSWRRVTDITLELGYCTSALEGTRKFSSAGVEYICDSQWKVLTKSDVLGTCTEDLEGKIRTYSYVDYACVNESWRTLTEYEKKLGVCSKVNDGDVKKIDYRSYQCSKGAWTYYSVTDANDSCTAKRAGETVKFNGEDFVCHNKRWVRFSDLEKKIGICNSEIDGQISPEVDGDFYECQKSVWVSVGIEGVLGTCSSTNAYTEKEYGDVNYFCTGKSWYPMTALEEENGICSKTRQGEVLTFDGHKYGCAYKSQMHPSEYYWVKFNRIDSLAGFCDGTFKWARVEGVDYACTPSYGYWHYNESFSSMWVSCSKDFYGQIVGFEGKEYYCGQFVTESSDTHWHQMTAVDSTEAGVCDYTRKGELMTFEGEQYKCAIPPTCDYSLYEWTKVEKEEE